MTWEQCSMCSYWAPIFDKFVKTEIPDEGPHIGLVCSEHASRPRHEFTTRPVTSFIGHFIKLGFDIPEEIQIRAHVGAKEHMWVAITGLAEDEDHDLHGCLFDIPHFAYPWEPFAELELKLEEIEDYMRGPGHQSE